MTARPFLAVPFAALAAVLAAADDKEPRPAEPAPLVVLDANGKEQKLKSWKFGEGVRRLGWLAPAGEKKAPPAGRRPTPAGPEALAVRAETEIEFADGVLTLLPLEHLRAVTFDAEAETLSAEVATAKGDEKVVGSTKYKRINKLVIEAEVDKGDLGVAEVKFLGGYPRGIRGVRFAAPRPMPAPPAGRAALVVSADGKSRTSRHKVVDLAPLYRLPDGGEKLLPTVMFRRTLKLELAKIKKVVVAAEGAWQVTLRDGGEETLTLLESIPFDGKQARLLGFVGRVPAGYKLFPAVAVAEITFDAEDK